MRADIDLPVDVFFSHFIKYLNAIKGISVIKAVLEGMIRIFPLVYYHMDTLLNSCFEFYCYPCKKRQTPMR